MEGPDIREELQDAFRQWYMDYKKQNDKLPDFPEDDEYTKPEFKFKPAAPVAPTTDGTAPPTTGSEEKDGARAVSAASRKPGSAGKKPGSAGKKPGSAPPKGAKEGEGDGEAEGFNLDKSVYLDDLKKKYALLQFVSSELSVRVASPLSRTFGIVEMSQTTLSSDTMLVSSKRTSGARWSKRCVRPCGED